MNDHEDMDPAGGLTMIVTWAVLGWAVFEFWRAVISYATHRAPASAESDQRLITGDLSAVTIVRPSPRPSPTATKFSWYWEGMSQE